MASVGFFPTGGSKVSDARATASCFCKAVVLEFPIEGPDLLDTFICNCVDCRKITASMFASNFSVADRSLTHLRGQEQLTSFAQSATIATGQTMTNYFCSKCGTLMYRVSTSLPGQSILRIGTVDDYSLHETKLKPRREQFVKDRVSWFTGGGEGVKQQYGNPMKDGDDVPWSEGNYKTVAI